MKKILLLSAPIGSGHIMTAKALEQEFLKYKDIEVVQGNTFDFLPQWLGKSFLKLYLGCLKLCPALYGLAYSSGECDGGFLWVRNLLHKLLLLRAKRYLAQLKPDIVIATHATPLGIMEQYKIEKPELPLYAVIPDYNIHKWWNCEGVNAYYLADEILQDRITVASKVKALGIPLRDSFKEFSREACRLEYGFTASEKVVVLMGGGEGLLPMEELIGKICQQETQNLKILAIAGKNEALVKQMQIRFGKDARVELYGFREDIPKLMAAADIIVTKAGAVTAAEVLASGLSYIIYKPLPGQEMGNAKFLVKEHAAMLATTVEEVIKYIQNPHILQQKKTLSQEARRLAAANICKDILQENK